MENTWVAFAILSMPGYWILDSKILEMRIRTRGVWVLVNMQGLHMLGFNMGE